MDEHNDHTGGHEPAAGRALTRLAVSATLHCLTGCAIGEVLGMVVGTALGWGNWPTVVLAVVLAFVFGYSLTVGPVLRAGVPFRQAVKVALAAEFHLLVVKRLAR